MTRSGPNGASTTASTATRGMLRLVGQRRPGQLVAQHAPDRQARQDQVAEAAASRSCPGRSTAGSEERLVAGQLALQHLDLVLARASGHFREVARDFLQADDVRIGETRCFGGDAPRVDASVDAATPLHVPAQQAHDWLESLNEESCTPALRYRRAG